MRTLTVARFINAPIEDVFEAYTDHEKLSQVFGVRSCVLSRQGDQEKNGLGAIRELDCGAIWLREEVTGFERPYRMDYRILASRPAAEHEFGRVDFTPVKNGTRVVWTTRFSTRLPGLGGMADPAFVLGFSIAFRLVLRNVDSRARALSRSRGR